MIKLVTIADGNNNTYNTNLRNNTNDKVYTNSFHPTEQICVSELNK